MDPTSQSGGKKNKIASLGLSLTNLMLGFALICTYHLSTAASLSFTNAPASIGYSDTFTVDVYINTQGADTNTVDVRIDYNPSVVTMLAMDPAGSAYYYDFGLSPDIFPIRAIDNLMGHAQTILAIPTGANANPAVNGANLFVTQLRFKAINTGNANIQIDFTGAGDSADSNVVQDSPIAGIELLSAVNNGGLDNLVVGALADADSDGLPDNLEMSICGTTTCLEPLADEDGDGISNLDEHAQGTDLTDADTDHDGDPDNIDPAPLDSLIFTPQDITQIPAITNTGMILLALLLASIGSWVRRRAGAES